MSVRGLDRSVEVINGSVTVCRRVGGLHKGSEKTLKVLKEGIVGIGVRGLRVRGSIQVYIHIYNFQ